MPSGHLGKRAEQAQKAGFEHCMVAKTRRILDAPPRCLRR